MDEARVEFEVALDMARRGREAWLENPTRENFVIWRDASETAHRWHRSIRLSGESSEAKDDKFDALLAG